MYNSRSLVAVLVTALALIAAAPAGRLAAQTADQLVPIPGNTPPGVGAATRAATPATAAAAPMTVTVVLHRDDEAGFQAALAAIEDPASPSYQHFLSQAELTARFGPSDQSYAAVQRYLQQAGLTVVSGSANHLTLMVSGSRAQMQSAFHTTIADFSINGRPAFSNTADPALPASIAGHVLTFEGLNNFGQPHPGDLRPLQPAQSAPRQRVASAPSPATGASIATAYGAGGLGAGVIGVGQKIGLVEFSNYNTSDLTTTLSTEGLPAALENNISTYPVNGGTTDVSGAVEDVLDIAAVLPIASGAHVTVYIAPNDGSVAWATMFNTMLNDGDTVISNSWTYCETYSSTGEVQGIDAVAQNGAASGVSIYTASGDYGNQCDSNNAVGTVNVPTDITDGVAVGGTDLQVGSGDSYAGESYWSGGGYGISALVGRPSWQTGFTSASGRSIPDVAADADPSTGIEVCIAAQSGCARWGGTSLSTPIWAAGIARVNQRVGHLTGNLLPTLYADAASGAFHTPASMASDFAHVGLGSFNLANLATQLGATGSSTVYGVTVNVSGCGTTSPSGTVTHLPGDSVSVSATACDSGHSFSGWSVSGASCSAGATANPCTFTMPAGNVSVTATFSVTPVSGSGCVLVGTQPSTGAQFTSCSLSGGTATLSWSAVAGGSYYVWFGRNAGGSDLAAQGPMSATSTTQSGLPTSGTIYVRLWTSVSGHFTYNDYSLANGTSGGGGGGGSTTYTLSVSANPSACNASVGGTGSGSYTAGTSISISAGACTGYSFSIWSVSGASCSAGASAAQCTFTMPSGNVTVTASYTASGGGGGGASGCVPVGTQTGGAQFTSCGLSGGTATLSWSAVGGGTYYVWFGRSVGGSDLAAQGPMSATSTTQGGLPTSGTIYLRLWTSISGHFTYNDYSLANGTSGGGGGGGATYTLSVSANPANCTTSPSGTVSHLAGDSISISANGCTGYSFSSWSVSGASCAGGAASNPCTFSMPAGNVSVSANYSASGGGGGGTSGCVLVGTQPSAGAQFTSCSLNGGTATLSWSAVGGGTYYVWFGRSVGGSDLAAQGPMSATSTTQSGLPTSGTIYIRLWTQVSGRYTYNDYTLANGAGGSATASDTPTP